MGKLLSLKLDVASRFDRSIIGINFKFGGNINGNNNKFSFTDVGDMGIEGKAFFKPSVLEEYDVDLNKLFIIPTDNGANLRKMVRLLGEQQNNISGNEEDEKSDSILSSTICKTGFNRYFISVDENDMVWIRT